MTRGGPAVTVLFCLLPCLATGADAWRDAHEAVAKLYGVGGVRGLEGYQTGFFIDDAGRVLTVQSPVLDAEPVVGIDAWGDRYELRVTGADAATGLALLEPLSPQQPPAAIELASAVQPAAADRLWCLTNLFAIAEGDEPVTAQAARLAGRGQMPAPEGPLARETRFAIGAPRPGSIVLVLDAVTSNPGAAGGLVVDSNGEPVGVLGAEVRSATTGAWMSYATPASLAVEAIERIRNDASDNKRRVDQLAAARRRATLERLGVSLIPAVSDRSPAYVESVVRGSTAWATGIRPDDLIVAVDGVTVGDVQGAKLFVGASIERDAKVELTILRDQQIVNVLLREEAP